MKRNSLSVKVFLASLLAVGFLTGPLAVTAQERIHGRVRAQPNVPPIDELEILDPRVDPEGKPHALQVVDPDGTTRIEIPPTVIVHRYYYTGDRDFQGPMLQGGPTLLAVNDPATGEQISVEAMLPPGAPRITYRRNRIVYAYRDCSIIVSFGHAGPLCLGTIGKPSVSVSHHSPALKTAARYAEQRRVSHQEWWGRTGISELTTSAAESSKGLANNAADEIKKVGTMVVAPVKMVLRATPLGSLASCQEKQPAYQSTAP